MGTGVLHPPPRPWIPFVHDHSGSLTDPADDAADVGGGQPLGIGLLLLVDRQRDRRAPDRVRSRFKISIQSRVGVGKRIASQFAAALQRLQWAVKSVWFCTSLSGHFDSQGS